MPRRAPPEFSWKRLRSHIRRRIARNQSVHCRLPIGVRLRIERQLPFLVVYRTPERTDAGTSELVTTEASWLIASGAAEIAAEVDELCRAIIVALQQHFGIVLLVEIWADELDLASGSPLPGEPAFELHAPGADEHPEIVEAFRAALAQIAIDGKTSRVNVLPRPLASPAGLPPLLDTQPPEDLEGRPSPQFVRFGLAVRPIYRDVATGTLYPLILQRLRRRLSSALRQGIHQFTGSKSPSAFSHFDVLGPSRVRKSAERVDRQLCQIADSYDFLLQVSPVNSEQAWHEFEAGGCRLAPHLYYRPLPYRPSRLKRQLFDVPIEHVDDPTLAWLFSQKQVEIDRELTALRDIDTPRFRYSSLQLFEKPDASLISLARSILQTPSSTQDQRPDRPDQLDAGKVAACARREIDAYRDEQPAFAARVEVIEGVAAGMMVVGDCLLISTSLSLPSDRVHSLLQHEVGTHLLTYFNGCTQPVRLLATGLAHAEGLQEGLAVFAEYLSGGLSAQRLHVLAARVIAVDGMLQGLPFEQTWHVLVQECGLQPRLAFTTTLRAYRGGGLTKDVVYLRGLQSLLSYLGKGHDLEPLYVGKLALQHVPVLEELRRRGIVHPPLVLPRFWKGGPFQERLDDCRGKTVVNLLHDALRIQDRQSRE